MWSYLKSLYTSTLESLGFSNREATIAFLGLDNSGKSTLQWKLKTGELKNFPPSLRPAVESLQVGNLTLHTWDLGGHTAAREGSWHKYCGAAHGVVFVVDAAEQKRLPEAAKELQDLAASVDLTRCPIAVFANKTDLPEAAGVTALETALALDDLRKTHKVALFLGSVVDGTGYPEAMVWLDEAIRALAAD